MALTKVSYSMITGAPVNVLDYGAVGDGIANDQPAIAAAMAAGDVVYLPGNRTYKIAANLNIPRSGITLLGDGPDSVISFSGNNRKIACEYDNFSMCNLFINGNKPTVGWETPNNYDFGLRVGESVVARINGFRIQNVTFKDIGLDGLYFENCGDVIVDENCQFINCRRWGIAVVGGTLGCSSIHILAKNFNQDFGGGPPGKAYPLGAIDFEPSGTGQSINYSVIDGAQCIVGDVAIAPAAGATVTNTVVRNVNIRGPGSLIAMNVGPTVVYENCNVTNGHFRAGYYADVFTTRPTVLNVTASKSANPPVTNTDGRNSLFPLDIVCDFNGTTPTAGGTYTVGYTNKFIDSGPATVTAITLDPGDGYYYTNYPTTVNIGVGDQVFLAMQIDRFDGSANDLGINWLRVVGGPFDRTMGDLPNGKNQWVFVSQIASTTYTNPTISMGLTNGALLPDTVSIRINKAFLLINPSMIDINALTAQKIGVTKRYSSWTGPTLDGYNIDMAILDASGAQNLDTINGGSVGKRISITTVPAVGTVTIRDTSVGSGNIKLINGTTTALTPGTSTTAYDFMYHTDGYWYQC